MNRFNKSIKRMRSLYTSRKIGRGGVRRALAMFIYKKNRILYSCDIPPQADIRNANFLHKGLGIVISPYAIIGNNTSIQHGVTLGTLRSDKDAPIIGENCFIGAKATILGNVHIGDNAKIGAGAVVLNDVESGATAVGVPAKIVKE